MERGLPLRVPSSRLAVRACCHGHQCRSAGSGWDTVEAHVAGPSLKTANGFSRASSTLLLVTSTRMEDCVPTPMLHPSFFEMTMKYAHLAPETRESAV
jgi:hypothetical protein